MSNRMIRPALLVVLTTFLLAAFPVLAQEEDDPEDLPPESVGIVEDGLSSMTVGTGKMPWEEYDQKVKASGAVGALGPDMFGDQVNFYDNTLSFSVTDVSVPGNFALPVAFTRKMSVENRHQWNGLDFPLADWDIDLPRISGVYGTTWATDRCTKQSAPHTIFVGTDPYLASDWWRGLQADMPSGGELLVPDQGAPQPSAGGPYKWMTSGLAYFSCVLSTATLPSGVTRNHAGDSFLAIAPDGTKYWFSWMAQNYQPPLGQPSDFDGSASPLDRKLNSLYVTKVEDRFGNWVTYTYSNISTKPVRLTSIQSSDSRSITLTYYSASGPLWKVATNGRTWTYGYTGSSLSSVLLPDGTSQWTYDFDGLSYAIIEPDGDPTGRTCDSANRSIGGGGSGTATHPSGATGTFVVEPARRGRSNVPKFCHNWEEFNDKTNDVAILPSNYEVLSITSKTIAGPGMAPQTWNFDGASDFGWADGTPFKGPWECTTLDCLEPVCVLDDCAGVTVSTITGPEGSSVKYVFGNSYRYNEGKLISVSRGTATSTLESELRTYELTQDSIEFATPIGRSVQALGAGFNSEYPRPQNSRTIHRDGATFTYSVNLFDTYMRPTNVDRFSSLINPATGLADFTKTEVTEYHDVPTAAWILGQVKKVTVNGTIAARTEFNVANLPWKSYEFEALVQTLTYNADGTVATVQDGKSNTTTATNWYRGTPQKIIFANGKWIEAVVNGSGWITQSKDQLGTATNYGYDPMGRLNLIDYTNLDSVAWSSTNRTFTKSTASAFSGSLAAGHWTQAVWTGNGRTTTWYDARWNPLVVLTEDTNNAASKSYVLNRYDADGRVVFQSYPVATLTTLTPTIPLQGITTVYDALGRVKEVKQDSEQGVLTTTTSYTAPFKTTVTNPRLFSTTTQYQAFDTPSTDAPVLIQAPETQTTKFSRDRFQAPLAITRSGTFGGSPISATRSYVYDANHRLCKTVEPESGATFLNYDLAGNIDWSATGQTLTNLVCDRNLVATAAKTTRTYDVLNRVKVIDVPNSTFDPTYDYFDDGALKSLDNGQAQWDYTYNLRRMPVNETLTYTGQPARTLVHGYDINGFELRLTYPSGLVVNAVPNSRGQATQASSFATGVTYLPNGGMQGFTYGNGIVHTLTTNDRRIPLRSLDKKAGQVAVLDDTYSYDANGNVSGIVDAVGAGTRELMIYDGLDRLNYVNAPAQSWENLLTYDPLDNIRYNKKGTREVTYAYNASNQIATLTKQLPDLPPVVSTLTHDARGNLETNGTHAFVFDMANRMTSVTGKEGYVYDGHGRRALIKNLTTNIVSFPMYSLSGQLVSEIDNRSNQETEYVYLNGSLVAKRFRTIGGSTWTTRYLHTDALGSPVVETDALAAIKEITRYTPYGEPDSYIQGPGFTGHVTDAATGLSYMQQRYYDPVLGRFLSVDPANSGFNRYAYASNNPLRFVDPDGRRDRDPRFKEGLPEPQLKPEVLRALKFGNEYRRAMNRVASRDPRPEKLKAVKEEREAGLVDARKAPEVIAKAVKAATVWQIIRGRAGDNVDKSERYVPTEKGLVDLRHLVSATMLPLGNLLGDAREMFGGGYSGWMQEDFLAHEGGARMQQFDDEYKAVEQFFERLGPVPVEEAQKAMKQP